ncbi:MAG TPA: hypothetical protein VJN21_07140 [Candidatus Acidoferrales bacterium]|nr:hypothetical protein [Candidatus Acidoferrales bacterium]
MSATQLRFNDFFDSGSVAPVSLGIDVNGNDPAANMFTTTNLPGISVNDINAAQQIYADVVGRVDGYSASVNLNPNVRQFVTGFPQLDKVSALEMGYYGSDSWQVRPGMTFTYGLRWEYQGIPHDKLNEYFNLQNGFAGVFGVSGLNNLFKPGTMTGSVPVISLNGSRNWYNKYYHSFGPTIGVAWQPGFQNSMYRRIFGGTGNTVFRAGYSVSFDRPGLNNFESLGPSNGGFVGFQFMNAGTTSAPGVFPGGSIALSSLSFPNVAQSPTSFTNSFPLDPLSGAGVNVYNPNLHAPYVQSWSAGIQRQLGANTVFEVRYVGNHAVGLWEQADLNETNIFENGFLTEFKNAQANLAINGGTSFADTGAGDVPVPILTAAFTGSTSGSQTDPLFSSGTFIRDLNLGLAGSFANSLAKDGSLTFICNMAGANFFPAGECPGSAPAVGAFPKNFFITNPDAVGGAFELYNGGQSTYNSLQLDVRRRMAAGLQFNGSYTFGKALTDQFVNSSISFFQFSTLRNPGLNKGPAPFDVRHSFKLESLYDLPFGPGHRMTTGNGVINRLIGGWSFNTVARWHSGRVQLLTGGLGGTFNGNDGGVNITGMSLSQIQSELGVIKTPCTTSGPSCTPTSKVGRVFYFPANLLGNGTNPLINGGGPANSAIFSACSTPGKFCGRPFIYGPEFFRADWSIDKMTKITERTTFELRLDALNVFNNADFFYGSSASGVAGSTSIQSNSFGRITNAYQDTGADDFGGRILQIVARINF